MGQRDVDRGTQIGMDEKRCDCCGCDRPLCAGARGFWPAPALQHAPAPFDSAAARIGTPESPGSSQPARAVLPPGTGVSAGSVLSACTASEPVPAQHAAQELAAIGSSAATEPRLCGARSVPRQPWRRPSGQFLSEWAVSKFAVSGFALSGIPSPEQYLSRSALHGPRLLASGLSGV